MSFWDSEEVLAELDKGAEKVFVKRVRKGNRDYIDVRTFWLDDSDEWRPSRKGIARYRWTSRKTCRKRY